MTLGCKKCNYNHNCKHYIGLYQIPMDSVICVCNECGMNVFHGNKKAADEFIKQKEMQPELPLDFTGEELC